jgi:hypothetical protein
MLIQDLRFFTNAEDAFSVVGGAYNASASAGVYTFAKDGNSIAVAGSSATGISNGSLTGTRTNGTSALYYRYSYGTGYAAAYGATYSAAPGSIGSVIVTAFDSSISSDIQS